MVNFKNLAVAATTLFGLVNTAPTAKVDSSKVIPGKYIVTLKSDIAAADVESHLSWVGDVHKRGLNERAEKGVERTYNGKYGFHGYAGSFDKSTIKEIKESPDVRHSNYTSLQNADVQFRLLSLKRIASGLSTWSRRTKRSLFPSVP